MTEHASLIHLDKARQEIALAVDIDEVKDIRDKAEALRVYQKQAGAGLEIQNRCAEIKIRAERRCGELLSEMEKNQGGDPTPSRHDRGLPPTLAEMGIHPMQSSRWQAIASLPSEDFETVIATTKGEGRELTSAQMIRNAKRRKKDNGEPEPTEPIVHFTTELETKRIDGIVTNLQAITITIQQKFKGWTASSRERVEEALADAVLATKGRKR